MPDDSTSDSRNVILPGISMSKRCTFRCVARSLPSGAKRSDVLWYLSVDSTYSGMLPPSKYVLDSAARAESAWYVGD